MKNTLFICAMALLLNSCGPSEEEIKMKIELANQQAENERLKVENAENQRKIEEERIRKEQAKIKASIENLAAKKREINSDLITAKSRLEDVKGFKLLRTSTEKEAQIREVVEIIQLLEERKQEIEEKIDELTKKIRQD